MILGRISEQKKRIICYGEGYSAHRAYYNFLRIPLAVCPNLCIFALSYDLSNKVYEEDDDH